MPGAKSCIRTCRHGLSVSADFGEWPDSSTRAGQGMDRGRCWLAGRPRTPRKLVTHHATPVASLKALCCKAFSAATPKTHRGDTERAEPA
jgi:hypothetical protein